MVSDSTTAPWFISDNMKYKFPVLAALNHQSPLNLLPLPHLLCCLSSNWVLLPLALAYSLHPNGSVLTSEVRWGSAVCLSLGAK